MNIFVYPRYSSNVVIAFIDNFMLSLEENNVKVVNKDDETHFWPMLFKHHSDCDIYLLNWIENIPNDRKWGMDIAFVLFISFFYIQKLRSRKFVWVYHNFTSHRKEGWKNKLLRNILIKRSDMIITLSQPAYDKLLQQTKIPVFFYTHPINSKLLELKGSSQPKSDILIWGTILRYKGIVEFLEMLYQKGIEGRYKIRIVGECRDREYESHLNRLCCNNIIFENRRSTNEELKGYIDNSKYVLFPYIGDSISSSGAVIDTITMGGCSIGSNKGAFNDLEREGVCITYDTYDSLLDIIASERIIQKNDIDKFITKNTWSNFAKSLSKKLEQLLYS